ncbi:hypothetical protein [Paenibacillus solani]|uniref:Uncharacterized protein n=1 Tax=Paenibacillus solani TaxID=1705565 RepID=A0A0M1P7B2_9BACL|nr:hypothetical protein [Paenibacillus solani]KOR90358.1 hypothetical protein AM231_15320 [Paenibacillus solani]
MNIDELQSIPINDAVSNELINTALDLTVDYSEIAFDSLLSDDLIREIPIVKSIVALGRFGISIKQLHFTKKVLCFLKEFHSRSSTNNIVKFKNKLNTDQKFKDKVTERIILIIDRLRTEQRAILLTKLLMGYIHEEYNWETFCYFSECLDSMQLIDIAVLDNLLTKESVEIENIAVSTFDKYMLLASIERLKSYGFVGVKDLSFIGSKGEFNKVAYISSLGKIIYNTIKV